MLTRNGIIRPNCPAWSVADMRWRSDFEAPIHVSYRIRRPGKWESYYEDFNEAISMYFDMLDQFPLIEYQFGVVVGLSTGGTHNYTIPTDWNSALNNINAIGPGANGIATGSKRYGGGGGAFALINNLAASPGDLISYIIGAGNSATDTQFKDGTTLVANAAPVLVASANSGPGGTAASSVGTTKFDGGGAGAIFATSPTLGMGGGGAGGPNGAGQPGGSPNSVNNGGTGGGAANGGSAGVTIASTSTGTDGGTNRFGTGAGTHNTGGTGITAGGGTNGGGGGGNGGGNNSTGGAGATELLWGSFGPGSGGGGCQSASLTTATGGAGGPFGGGGGAAFVTGSGAAATGGAGGQGLVVVVYTPNSLRRPIRKLYFHSRRH